MAVKKRRKRKIGASSSGGGQVDTGLRPYPVTKTPPCQNTCPAGNDVRGMLTALSQTEKWGRTLEQSYEKAFYKMAETTPLLSICGRVCPHPCETGCNRKEVDKSVGINQIERSVGDWALEKGLKLKPLGDKRSEKIAVIGAGPAGLTCAYQLARRGYGVTIFEMYPETGGMLRYGIPAYRLPRKVIDDEVKRIAELGVEIKCNTKIGKDISYEDLKKDFDAVFVGIGAHQGKLLGLDNENAPNVWTGTDFLREIYSDKKPDIGKSVYVIGGGDTAIDAARMSIRNGAKATILYRRTRAEMPAIEEEIEEALAENVTIEFLAAPVGLIKEGDKVTGMKAITMELGEPDSSGRRRPVPIEGSEHDIKCDTIVAAISQWPEIEPFKELTNEKGWVTADDYGVSQADKVWVGGDVIDLALVTTAIGQGRLAAEDIDRKIKGEERPPESKPNIITHDKMALDYFEKKDRNDPSLMEVDKRWADGDAELNPGFNAEQIKAESERCMSCGYCFDCERCWMYCQASSISKGEPEGPYTYKHETCVGCKKCAEACPCGFIDMT